MDISKQLGTEFHNLLTRNLGLAMLIGWTIAGLFLIRLIFRWKTCGRIKTTVYLFAGLAIAAVFISLESYINRIYLMEFYHRRRELSYRLRIIQENRDFLKSIRVEVGQPVPEFTVTAENGSSLKLPVAGKATLLFFYARESSYDLNQIRIIENIQRDLQDTSMIEAMAVGLKYSHQEVKQFMAQYGIKLAFAADPEGKAYETLCDPPEKLETNGDPRLENLAKMIETSLKAQVFLLSSEGELIFFARELDEGAFEALKTYLKIEEQKLKDNELLEI